MPGTEPGPSPETESLEAELLDPLKEAAGTNLRTTRGPGREAVDATDQRTDDPGQFDSRDPGCFDSRAGSASQAIFDPVKLLGQHP